MPEEMSINQSTRIPYNRAAALSWWKKEPFANKQAYVKQWQEQLPEYNSKKTWDFALVYYSDQTIEEIYNWMYPIKK